MLRYQELFPALCFGGECILTALFSMSLASPMYFWMSLLSQTSRVGLAWPSSMCRRKDVRRSSPGETGLPWAPLSGQLQPRALTTPHPSSMVALWWRCGGRFRGGQGGPGAALGSVSAGAWCFLGRHRASLLVCAEGMHICVGARFFGSAAGGEQSRGQPSPSVPGTALGVTCTLGNPACSIPQRMSAPHRSSGQGLACWHCLPQRCQHTADPGTS